MRNIIHCIWTEQLEKKKPAESRGTMLFLQMLRDYRPILFICGAIIFKKTNQAEKNPKSVIFSKLPFWDNEVQKWAEEEYLPWYQAKMAEPVDDVQINDEAVKKGFTKLNDQLRCLRSELNQGLNDIREGQRKQQEMLELLLGRVGFTFNGI
ncbi:hypothetical protein BKA69DRAFT_208568 [Paraphysoderma sedebokerense]|nr:hypothetical protein BKA69DRAFT_208568 [Paraphysoderma sedebokerense]